MFERASRQHRIFAILMLLGLLFQVQTVLACQMTGTSQPVEHCCCDHAKPSEHTKPSDHTPDQHAEDACCELDTELSLKEPDLEKEQLAVVQSPPTVDVSEAVVLVLLAAIWQEGFSDSAPRTSWLDEPPPGVPGSKTYLSTQRLRI